MCDFIEADFSKAQLNISSFEPHHTTQISYPDLTLLKHDEIGYSLWDLDDDEVITRERYEPLPLIADPAVQAHAGRENEEETSFFTRAKARLAWPHAQIFQPSSMNSDFERLLQDMRAVEQYVGTTELSMLTRIMLHHSGNTVNTSTEVARIKRVTEFWQVGGTTYENTDMYEFALSRLHDDLPLPHGAAWFLHLSQLVMRRGDRSYRHVRLRLKNQEDVDYRTATKFKPKRQGNASELLDSKLTPVDPRTLDKDDKQCVVCANTLGEKDAPDPVTTPCDGKHCFMCKQCIIAWVDSTAPEKEKTCPRCRRLLIGCKEFEDFRFGLVNGEYEYDKRFTPWENFERSCADLDQELANNKDDHFTPTANLFVQIWDIVQDGARLESDDGMSPSNLLPTAFEEWEIADAVIRQQVFMCNGHSTYTKHFVARTFNSVYGAFVCKFRQAGLDQLINAEE